MLTELVGELSMRSEEFRGRWAAHDVKYYRSGVQPFRHPLAGDLTLDYDALEIPADTGQTIVAYTAEPGSPSQQALNLLASWPRRRAASRPSRPATRSEPGTPLVNVAKAKGAFTMQKRRLGASGLEVSAIGLGLSEAAALTIRRAHAVQPVTAYPEHLERMTGL